MTGNQSLHAVRPFNVNLCRSPWTSWDLRERGISSCEYGTFRYPPWNHHGCFRGVNSCSIILHPLSSSRSCRRTTSSLHSVFPSSRHTRSNSETTTKLLKNTEISSFFSHIWSLTFYSWYNAVCLFVCLFPQAPQPFHIRRAFRKSNLSFNVLIVHYRIQTPVHSQTRSKNRKCFFPTWRFDFGLWRSSKAEQLQRACTRKDEKDAGASSRRRFIEGSCSFSYFRTCCSAGI